MSLLAMSDPAAHPALLAPHFTTSFTSATTGHSFSSWGIGTTPLTPDETGRHASEANERDDSIPRSDNRSRSCALKSVSSLRRDFVWLRFGRFFLQVVQTHPPEKVFGLRAAGLELWRLGEERRDFVTKCDEFGIEVGINQLLLRS
jgi:hypothetical protein